MTRQTMHILAIFRDVMTKSNVLWSVEKRRPPRTRIWLLLGSVSLFVGGCWPFDSDFVSACEQALKERLRSPSQYERVEVTERIEELTLHQLEQEGYDVDTNTLRLGIEEGRIVPKKYTAFIDYDAPNAYGTMVRGLAMCEYLSAFGNLNHVSEHNVSIDGQTNQDRLIEGVLNRS